MNRDISNTPLEVIEKMTDQELRRLLKEDMDIGLGMVILREINARDMKRLAKPHWSVTPNFWLTFIAAVSGVAGVVIQLKTSQEPQSEPTSSVVHPAPANSMQQTKDLKPPETGTAKR